MNTDKTITHHLWWLNKFLNDSFKGREHKDVIFEGLNSDICRELDDLVSHIKSNY